MLRLAASRCVQAIAPSITAAPLAASLRLFSRAAQLGDIPAAGAEDIEPQELKVKINGRSFNIPAGNTKTVLQACREAGVYVPTLCYHPRLGVKGSCRLCLVEVSGSRTPMVTACTTPLYEGMEIYTNTPDVQESVKSNLSLLRSRHPNDCMTCSVSGNCEFQDLLYRYQVEERWPTVHRGVHVGQTHAPCANGIPLDETNSIVRDMDKCILCGRCVTICKDTQGMNILGYAARGGEEIVDTVGGRPLEDTECIQCGQCSVVCPVGAITENSHIHKVQSVLKTGADKTEPRQIRIVSTAPSIRVALGEELGMATGAIATGQMVAALRRLGWDQCFDTNFTADLTTIEEAYEFIGRLQTGGPFPMFTSCCPAWVNLVEKVYPEFIPNLSSCKSPQGMTGALTKSYYAKVLGVEPDQIHLTSVMPCTAKKDEVARPQLAYKHTKADGTEVEILETDAVLTTRELAKMIKMEKIPFASLPEDKFDNPMGISSGSGAIFGASGGVMESALRTAYETVTQKTLDRVEFHAVRGTEGVREAVVDVDGTEVSVAIATGTAGLHKLIQKIKDGAQYHFVEMMSCPGGCVNGGGEPKTQDPDYLKKRIDAIYKVDETSELRRSHDNPSVLQLYKDYLGEINGHTAHELLHTHYSPRPVNA